jgi:hypothetical protein
MEGIVVVVALVVAVVVAGVAGVRRRARGPGTEGAVSPLPERSKANRMRASEGPTHHGPVESGPVYRHETAEPRSDQD